MRDALIASIARATIYPYNKSKYRAYQATLGNARQIEQDDLLALIERHQHTDFGRAHNFARIRTVDDFQNQIPITDYADLAPYFDAVARGQTNALLPANERILEFTCTSGTTGEPKILPVTGNWLKTYQRHWRLWGIKALVDHPGILQKKWLQISGPATVGVTPAGKRYGMISAITARHQNPILQYGFAAPFEVGDIAGNQTRGYAILRLAIAQSVGFIITVTPANLIRFAELADRSKQILIRDLYDGTMTGGTPGCELPEGRLRAMMRKRHPERARALERIVKETGTLYPKDFWQLELVACWVGGTVGYQSQNLAKYYGATPVRDTGYVSTEGRHTIPVADFTAHGVLVTGGAFYEFIPEDGGTPCRAAGLEAGQDYQVLLTSSQGLYRYRMGDIVRCHGFEGQAPILEFIRKTSQFSDMEGEKISGDQIVGAMMTCTARLGLAVETFGAIPVRPQQGAPYYAFVLENPGPAPGSVEQDLLRMLDDELQKLSIAYQLRRNDTSIAAARLFIVETGTFTALTETFGARFGTGETQYKQAALLDPELLTTLRILRTVENKTAAQDGLETAV